MEKVNLNLKEIGKRLKEARKALNKTQNDMSELCGIQHSVISEMENGLRKPYPLYLKLLSELKVNLNWIFNGKGSMFADFEINWDFGKDNETIKELIYLLENAPLIRFEILRNFLVLKSKNIEAIEDILSKMKIE
jgi:transcriptional regulator with XRE-family HTH domain